MSMVFKVPTEQSTIMGKIVSSEPYEFHSDYVSPLCGAVVQKVSFNT